jgi:endonuclease/exonuclease/phosphatase family metal-dependent hydrolase
MRSTALALAAATAASLALLVSPLTAQATPTANQSDSVLTASGSTTVRFATFNVRTARADIGTSRHWLRRARAVAREIQSRSPGIVALQELGPGRADGRKAKIGNALRQTTSLERELRAIGAGRYHLVRTTAYVAPGTSHGTQGARILYDANRYKLVSWCPETTRKKNYNRSCAIDLPLLGGDSRSKTRSAAYAEFKNRSTGASFFAISAHLDDRHSGSLNKERAYDALRAAQVRRVYDKVASLAGRKPILFGGDINSWKTKAGSNAPFNTLVSRGFRDSTGASSRTDAQFPTVNHFKTTLKANAKGRQVALDVVMAKNVRGFQTYENVMKTVDSRRPSDHNMVVASVAL